MRKIQPKVRRKAPWIAGLILAATGALIWTQILLLSQNTLLLNGHWVAAKRNLQMFVMGGDTFLVGRPALNRGRLNMGSCYGFNEVLYRDAVRPREFRFLLTLEDKAELSVLFSEEASSGAVSGFRFTRDPDRRAFFFESAPSGQFLSKSEVAPFPLDDGRHLVSLRFHDGRVRVFLDGKEVASRAEDTERDRRLGWRAGGGRSFIGDVLIEDSSGGTFSESFRNTRHWRRILLIHAAVFLSMLAAATFIPSFNGTGLLLALNVFGFLWLGFDYSYWSTVPVDGLTHSLFAKKPYSVVWAVERLRYEAFESWNGLLTGDAAPKPQDVVHQGYAASRISRGAIYCSPASACALEPAPLFPVQKQAYRILLIGTSQAYGAGADRLEDTFFVQVHGLLARHFLGRLKVESLNMSASGSNAHALLAEYEERFSAFRPDLILISLGNNDRRASLRSGLSDLLALAQSQGVKTMLLKEGNFRADALDVQTNMQAVQDLGDEFQSPVLDFNGFLKARQDADSGFLWWDNYHLTSYGQTLAAKWLAPRIIAFIEGSRRKAPPAVESELSQIGLAQVKEELGRWGEAAEIYARAREKSPDNYALCMKLARAYLQMGRLDLAKQTYAQAKGIDPKQANAYIIEGYAMLDAGESAQAKEQFESVIALDTSSPYGYHHMASYFRSRGDTASAEQSLRKAQDLLRTQPRTPSRRNDVLHALFNLALVKIDEGRLDEAGSVLRQALSEPGAKSEWDAIILVKLGSVYAGQGKREQAEASFLQAAALCEPEAACVRWMPIKSRRSDWATEVRLRPLIELGALYADESRKAQVEAAAEKALSRLPDADQMGPYELSFVVAIGELYYRIGDDAQAGRLFRLAVFQLGRMPPATTSGATLGSAEAHLASLCKKSDRYEEAARHFREAIRIGRLQGQPVARFELPLAETRMRAWLSRFGLP